MANRKTPISLALEPAQLDALRARSVRTGTPVAELIRRAVDRDLDLAPIDPLSVIAQEPGFLASLTDAECVVLARRLGIVGADGKRVAP